MSSSSSGSSKEREAVKVQELAERLEEVERINAKLKKKEKEFKFTKGSHLEKKAASFRILSKSQLGGDNNGFDFRELIEDAEDAAETAKGGSRKELGERGAGSRGQRSC